jgi:alpha-glucosidase
MYDVLRFWLDRGVDGFRVDVLWMLIKDEQLRDNPVNPDWKPGDNPVMSQFRQYTEDQPEVHEIIREMRSLLDSYGERVFIGEIYLPIPRLMQYYGEMLDETHLPFNFQLVTTPTWEARVVRQIVDEYEKGLPAGAWPNWVLGNHDVSRIATRIGREQARLAQMLLLTLRGTPTCYYGDELGMLNGYVPPELLYDPAGKDNPEHSRDYGRTPMQWDNSTNAGFSASDVTTWLPVAKDYQTYNVATEQQDPRSFLTLTRTLLDVRRSLAALTVGSYQSLDQDNDTCFVYQRQHGEASYLVVLNFSNQEQVVKLAESGQGRILISTYLDREDVAQLSEIRLRGNEGLLIQREG